MCGNGQFKVSGSRVTRVVTSKTYYNMYLSIYLFIVKMKSANICYRIGFTQGKLTHKRSFPGQLADIDLSTIESISLNK